MAPRDEKRNRNRRSHAHMFDLARIRRRERHSLSLQRLRNVTRFDVLATRRTRAFHHYTIGGDLEIEEEEVLEERVEQVTCRWCNASGDKIEALPA